MRSCHNDMRRKTVFVTSDYEFYILKNEKYVLLHRGSSYKDIFTLYYHDYKYEENPFQNTLNGDFKFDLYPSEIILFLYEKNKNKFETVTEEHISSFKIVNNIIQTPSS